MGAHCDKNIIVVVIIVVWVMSVVLLEFCLSIKLFFFFFCMGDILTKLCIIYYNNLHYDIYFYFLD